MLLLLLKNFDCSPITHQPCKFIFYVVLMFFSCFLFSLNIMTIFLN